MGHGASVLHGPRPFRVGSGLVLEVLPAQRLASRGPRAAPGHHARPRTRRMSTLEGKTPPGPLEGGRSQWTVLSAAWLGGAFAVFDGLLFNYGPPNGGPTLPPLPLGSPE